MPSKPEGTSYKRTSEYVYSLPLNRSRRYNNAAVNASMSDERPIPMKNMKPAQKKPTGAEHFREEHHAEYETQGQTASRYRHVNCHNSAYPQLKDELNKRQSTVKVIAISKKPINGAERIVSAKAGYDPNCKKCVREKLRAEKNKKDKANKKVSRRKRDKRVRIAKSKRSLRRRMHTALRNMRKNISCQCFPPANSKGTSAEQNQKLPTLLFKMADENKAPNVLGSYSRSFDGDEIQSRDGVKSSCHTIRSGSKNPSKLEVAYKKYPNTTEPSVSSYNSFMSMDHEPMVTQ